MNPILPATDNVAGGSAIPLPKQFSFNVPISPCRSVHDRARGQKQGPLLACTVLFVTAPTHSLCSIADWISTYAVAECDGQQGE
jgi:hypothetical protein